MKKLKIMMNLILTCLFLAGNFLFLANFSLAKTLPEYREGELLVKLKNGDEFIKFKFNDSVDLNKVILQYQKNDLVEYVEPNYKFMMAAFPNDPDYPLQWYFDPIKARDAWSQDLLIRQQEGITRSAVIAVLDTGVDLNHPDLKDKIWINRKEIANDGIDNDKNGFVDDINGWNFVEDNNNPNPALTGSYSPDAVKHGTIVAGIAAASTNNNLGIAGVSWSAQIMPLRVLDSTGTGDVNTVVEAIDYAVANGADVISMSFVGSSFSRPLADAIKRAYDKGVLIVAAAGNTDASINGIDLDVTKSYPVCNDGDNGENMVIGVASVGKDLRKSNFSDYGGCVDLTAPGEDFYSTQVYRANVDSFNKYYNGYWSGTSLSAPLVSGAAALVKALRPDFSANQIKSFILNSTQDISSYNLSYKGKLGSGLLNVSAALQMALNPPPEIKKTVTKNYIVAALGYRSFPQIKVLNSDGSVFKAFYTYSPYFNGPINVATGDVNGDGKDEIITGAGAGGGPHIRVFNVEGQPVSQFFAYNSKLSGGVYVAAADVNGDGKNEIITGSGKGGQPEVKIFDYQGNLLSHFLAYNTNFLGGVKVAGADLDRDGKAEIVTGTGAGGGPHVRIFKVDGQLVSQFFAYNENFRGGINIAVGDVYGDGQANIIVSPEKEAVASVRIFTYFGTIANSFFAYDINYMKGIYLAIGDIDKDGKPDIITGSGIGAGSQIKIFDFSGILKSQFLAHTKDYIGGVRPAVFNY